MADVAAQLVGRDAEIERVEGVLADVGAGRAAVLEIVGEPGIGKTRLLAELRERAEARGWLVLTGSASELEDDLPFGVFVEALDDHVRDLDPSRFDELGEDVRAELPSVLPSLPATRGPGTGLQIERYRSYRAVRRLLEALADDTPLVLCLDDMQWADPGSLELLDALLRRPLRSPVLLALAVREQQWPDRLSGALERARRAGWLTAVELAPLAAEDARTLLGGLVSGTLAESLYRDAGGNPFYLEELARNVARRAAGEGIPQSVVAAVEYEVALLEVETREVLHGAAVAGDPFDPELAAEAAGLPEALGLDALDALLQRDLIRPTDVPRRFRFRHPLVRSAIYQAIPGGWRLRAHERCAEALARRGAPAALRAHHVEHAAVHGDAAAVALLREAGEATASHTPASAARWFGAALRLLSETAPAAERIDLLTALAGARSATGDFEGARTALLEAIGIAATQPAARRVQLVEACASIERVLGRSEEARGRLESALDEVDGREAASLMIGLGVDAFYRMDRACSQKWGDRSLDIARPLGDAALTAAASATVASSLACSGAGTAAEAYRTEAAVLVDALDDDRLAARLDAIAQLAGAEVYLGRCADGLAHAQRGIAIARATGQGDLFPVLIPAVIGALFMLGRLAEATELLDGAIEGARLTGNTQPLAWYLLSRASVQMLLGDLDAAVRSAEESVELSRGLDIALMTSYADEIHGLVCIEAGDSERGVATLISGGGGPSLPLSPGAWRPWDLDRLTAGLLACGRHPEAEHAAAEAEQAAAAAGRDFGAAAARRARARVALASGDADVAAGLAVSSAEAADAAGAVVEAALSRLLAGRALREAGDQARATAELEIAAPILEARGVVRHHLEAERELRRLGRRSRRGAQTGAGVESLSERELEVARLVVDRRTNPEIAAELFLSQKTVESHIRNVFRKLGVSSRTEVARTIEAADLSSR